jgi:hypothetical protein
MSMTTSASFTEPPGSASSERHSAGSDLFGKDLEDEALLGRVSPRVPVLTKVFLRQLVNVLIRAVRGYFHDTTVYRDQPIGVRGIDHVDGDTGVTLHIFGLLSGVRDIHKEMGAVGVDPHLGQVWRTVAVESRDLGEGRLLDQPDHPGRKALRHDSLQHSCLALQV